MINFSKHNVKVPQQQNDAFCEAQMALLKAEANYELQMAALEEEAVENLGPEPEADDPRWDAWDDAYEEMRDCYAIDAAIDAKVDAQQALCAAYVAACEAIGAPEVVLGVPVLQKIRDLASGAVVVGRDSVVGRLKAL